MKKIRRISALLSAIIMVCSTVNAAPVNVFAAEGEGNFPNARTIKTDWIKFDPAKLDVNGDGKINYYDVSEIETYINDLYETRNISYYQRSDDGSYSFNSLAVETETDKKYDLNKDNVLSPDDYCNLLCLITKQFKYSISQNAGNNTQLTASIDGYNLSGDPTELVIPSEIYDINTDRIYPVTNISYGAFYSMKKLETVEFINYRQPNWVDEYGNRIATRGQITASNPLSIAHYAFAKCTKLKTVVFPENVSVENTTFEGTPFFNNNSNDYDGVKVLTGSADHDKKTYSVVYDIDFDRAVGQNGDLNIPACVSAIRNNITNGGYPGLRNINFKKNSSGSYNLRFIGAKAFEGCDNLVTVNNRSFAENDEYLKDQLYKYSSAFDCTAFMAAETSRQLDKIVSKIESTPGYDKMNDGEKALIAAKYIVYNIYYSSWYSTSGEFSLYPNSLYSTIDVLRESYESENAGLNVRFTVCEGISRTYALVLDRIGVKNFTMGLHGHATNQVYIPKCKGKDGSEVGGHWYTMDITGLCGARAREVMGSADREEDISKLRGYDDTVDINNSGSSAVDSMTIKGEYLNTLNVKDNAYNNIMNDDFEIESRLSNRNFFHLFSASAGKHVTGNNEFFFVFNKDNTQLLLYRYGKILDPQVVKEQAEKQPALKAEIDAGLVGFVDATQNEVFDNGDVVYELTDGLYDVKYKESFDEEHRYHGGNGKIVYGNWFAVGGLTIRDVPDKSYAYFAADSDGKVYMDRPYNTQAIVFEKKDNKIYAYDLNNVPLDGVYTRYKYIWSFENGELVYSNCY